MWKKGATVQQNCEWYMYLRPKLAMSEMGENCHVDDKLSFRQGDAKTGNV